MLSLNQIDLDLIMIVMEDNSFDQSFWIDPASGVIHGSFDDDYDADEGDGAGWVMIESLSSRDSYRDMEAFIGNLDDQHVASTLSDAIVGKGAFRRFKDIVFASDELGPSWRHFEESARRKRAIEWLADAGLIDHRAAPPMLSLVPPLPAEPTAACTVRRSGPDDLLAVLAVHADEHGQSPPTEASHQQTMMWTRMHTEQIGGAYVAEVDGSIVGTATLMVMLNITYDCAPSAIIEAVVVDRAFRRRGIASALLQRILADTTELGCDKVQLLSHKRHADDGGHALYRSLGFEAEAEGFRLYHRRR
ncbi:MAG: GNAT family N-acetyltransferase [Ilumatobacteraceae bacterium]